MKKILVLFSFFFIIYIAFLLIKFKTSLPSTDSVSNSEIDQSTDAINDNNDTEDSIDDQIKNEMLLISDSYKNLYVSLSKNETLNLSSETKENILNKIAETGFSVITKDKNMRNPNNIRNFNSNIKKGINCNVTIYELSNNILVRYFFEFSANHLTVTITPAHWDNSNKLEIEYTDKWDIDRFKFTNNGYFLYHISYPISLGGGEDSYGFRIEPLPDENRLFCDKYIKSIGYIGNNIFTESWTSKTLNKLNFNDMFEYIYKLDTGKEPPYSEPYKNEKIVLGGQPIVISIPQDDFENIITKYFPITPKQLRSTAVYNSDKKCYPWLMFFSPQFSQTPEVIDVKHNSDKSITLTVNAVDIEHYSDCDFKNVVTIMNYDNNNFKYLSNSITKLVQDNFPEYVQRITK
ncbi:MAG: hypothetical protein E7214_06950 [Clostridium sp.]|nr:hypothetical protein [Clostridium sp.]